MLTMFSHYFTGCVRVLLVSLEDFKRKRKEGGILGFIKSVGDATCALQSQAESEAAICVCENMSLLSSLSF